MHRNAVGNPLGSLNKTNGSKMHQSAYFVPHDGGPSDEVDSDWMRRVKGRVQI